MTTFVCATLVYASLAAAGAETYAEAHRSSVQTGRPMVVMVGTDWCPPCQQMKKTVLPQVRQRGLLRKVAFACINPDRDSELAAKLTGGGPVPQLVMYRRTANGWRRRKLVGGQSVDAVEKFINEGLALDEAENGVAAKAQPEASASNARAG